METEPHFGARFANHMWLRKTISKEEMGKGLWRLCCNRAQDFSTNLGPKLKANGFLQDPSEEAPFFLETIKLHLWIISFLLRVDGDVLDVVHSIFVSSNPNASENLTALYALYNEACTKDKELHSKGLMTTTLATTALRFLVGNGKPDEQNFGFLIIVETDTLISATFTAVREFRAKFDIH